MKRSIFKICFSLLVFTYVFSSVGICIVGHYCGGELEEISLFSNPDSCCDGTEEDETAGCCSNDSQHVAFQKDFTFHTFFTDAKAPVQQLFWIEPARISFLRHQSPLSLFIQLRQAHPPNRVQEAIVAESVLRI